jgi:hypothetical protein
LTRYVTHDSVDEHKQQENPMSGEHTEIEAAVAELIDEMEGDQGDAHEI